MIKISKCRLVLLLQITICFSSSSCDTAFAGESKSVETTISADVESRMQDMAGKSEAVLVAEADEKVPSSDGLTVVRLRIKDIIKGPPYGKSIPIRYEANETVPELKSDWILFIESFVSADPYLKTLGNAHGRLPATDENMKLIYRIVGREIPMRLQKRPRSRHRG